MVEDESGVRWAIGVAGRLRRRGRERVAPALRRGDEDAELRADEARTSVEARALEARLAAEPPLREIGGAAERGGREVGTRRRALPDARLAAVDRAQEVRPSRERGPGEAHGPLEHGVVEARVVLEARAGKAHRACERDVAEAGRPAEARLPEGREAERGALEVGRVVERGEEEARAADPGAAVAAADEHRLLELGPGGVERGEAAQPAPGGRAGEHRVPEVELVEGPAAATDRHVRLPELHLAVDVHPLEPHRLGSAGELDEVRGADRSAGRWAPRRVRGRGREECKDDCCGANHDGVRRLSAGRRLATAEAHYA